MRLHLGITTPPRLRGNERFFMRKHLTDRCEVIDRLSACDRVRMYQFCSLLRCKQFEFERLCCDGLAPPMYFNKNKRVFEWDSVEVKRYFVEGDEYRPPMIDKSDIVVFNGYQPSSGYIGGFNALKVIRAFLKIERGVLKEQVRTRCPRGALAIEREKNGSING